MKLEVNVFKKLMGVAVDDHSKDTIFSFILDDVEEIILNYCHIKKLPDGLKNTAYRMAMDMYSHEGWSANNSGSGSAGEGQGGAVKSITEGDVSISFSTTSAEASASHYYQGLLKNYSSQLERFRKLVW